MRRVGKEVTNPHKIVRDADGILRIFHSIVIVSALLVIFSIVVPNAPVWAQGFNPGGGGGGMPGGGPGGGGGGGNGEDGVISKLEEEERKANFKSAFKSTSRQNLLSNITNPVQNVLVMKGNQWDKEEGGGGGGGGGGDDKLPNPGAQKLQTHMSFGGINSAFNSIMKSSEVADKLDEGNLSSKRSREWGTRREAQPATASALEGAMQASYAHATASTLKHLTNLVTFMAVDKSGQTIRNVVACMYKQREEGMPEEKAFTFCYGDPADPEESEEEYDKSGSTEDVFSFEDRPEYKAANGKQKEELTLTDLAFKSQKESGGGGGGGGAGNRGKDNEKLAGEFKKNIGDVKFKQESSSGGGGGGGSGSGGGMVKYSWQIIPPEEDANKRHRRLVYEIFDKIIEKAEDYCKYHKGEDEGGGGGGGGGEEDEVFPDEKEWFLENMEEEDAVMLSASGFAMTPVEFKAIHESYARQQRNKDLECDKYKDLIKLKEEDSGGGGGGGGGGDLVLYQVKSNIASIAHLLAMGQVYSYCKRAEYYARRFMLDNAELGQTMMQMVWDACGVIDSAELEKKSSETKVAYFDLTTKMHLEQDSNQGASTNYHAFGEAKPAYGGDMGKAPGGAK